MRDGINISGQDAPSADSGGLALAVADGSVRLFGLDVMDTTIARAAQWIVSRAQHNVATEICFLNADCVNVMYRNKGYRAVLQNADRIFADGIGVRLAAKAAGRTLKDNVNGTDLFPVLCTHAARAGVGVYLFGAREGRAAAAGERMVRDNPELTISGCHHGYIKDDADEARLIDVINASGAGILLVGLGAPRQEQWIARNRHRLRPAVVMGIGGLFDYYSGSVPRAPLLVRKVHMEWAWRLAMEPRRLARRYLLGNIAFMARLAHARLLSAAAFRQQPAH